MKEHDRVSEPAPQRRRYTQAELRVVAFEMAGHEYVLDAGLVQEIVRPTGLMHVAGAPEYVAGVIERRERIVPVVQLSQRLSLPASPPTPETCVIVVELPIGPVGFMVDSVSELMWVNTHDFEIPSPVVAQADQLYFQGIAHLGDRLLVMLDLERLLSLAEQQTLSDLDLSSVEGSTLPPPTRPKRQQETLFSGQRDPEAVEAARAQGQARADLRRLMTFELSGELYGVSATDVTEIREPLPLMPLPNVPDHVLGLINLRGTVLPVLDLRRKFGLDLKPDGPGKRFIILEGPGYLVALRVDSVYGLARLPRADFQPAPPGVARLAPECYDQVIVLDGRMLIELNVEELLANTAIQAEEP